MIDRNSPASGSVTRQKRVSLDLVHVVLARLARADRGFDRLDLVNVYDVVATVSRDTEHAVQLEVDVGTGGIRYSVMLGTLAGLTEDGVDFREVFFSEDLGPGRLGAVGFPGSETQATAVLCPVDIETLADQGLNPRLDLPKRDIDRAEHLHSEVLDEAATAQVAALRPLVKSIELGLELRTESVIHVFLSPSDCPAQRTGPPSIAFDHTRDQRVARMPRPGCASTKTMTSAN
jgi:hypothetical protein